MFCWITLFGSDSAEMPRWLSSGFDPCSAGSRSSAAVDSWPGGVRWLVSILVLLDHALRRCCTATNWRTAQVFRSLFCWITLFGPASGHVVARLAAEFRSLFCWITLFGSVHAKRRIATGAGFDPCSAGSRSSARCTSRLRQQAGEEFRSLFCWITLIGWLLADGRARQGRVSILVLLDHPHRHVCLRRGVVVDEVSILVLLDHPLRHLRDRERELLDEMFRSLFCWITLSAAVPPAAPPSYAPCFDPCSAGSPFGGRRSRRALVQRRDRFRSLFCWITLWRDVAASAATSRRWFRSLFCWITLSDMSPASDCRLPHIEVSILVLLDHPLGMTASD